MFKQISATLLVGLLSLSNGAQAALQTGNWKTTNDKQVVIDTTSGLEWLTLNNTKGKSINDVLGQGGTYAGWRLPTEAEVLALTTQLYGNLLGQTAANTSYNLGSLYVPRVDARQQAFNTYYNMMGSTYFADGSNAYEGGYWYDAYSAGVYLNSNPGVGNQPSQILYSGMATHRGGIQARDYLNAYTGYDTSWNMNTRGTSTGVFLVSDGGLTLSSQQNPLINQNNQAAPNQLPRYTTSATVGEITKTSASLNLNYNGSDYTGFTYKVNGGASQQSTTGLITLTDLLAGTNYLVEYTAYNANGTSTQWNQQLITTQVADVSVAAFGGLASLLLLFRMRRKA